MPVRALKRKKWRDTLPMLQLLLPALPHNAALCPMSHVVCNDAVLVYLNTNKLKQGRGSLLTRTLALKTTFFYFFSSAVTFRNEISAWPGPPSGHGIMRYCGNSCYLTKTGVSDGCHDGCRCVPLDFKRGVYDGPGNCYKEEWN
uniref:8 kDa Amblyomma family member n=1 Tax=Rhipicephalus appendiculatus TaxID=34631 RepID=A0A131YK58_RHIAP